MDILIFSIDPMNFYIYFWIFVIIALLLGVMIYFIFRKRQPGWLQFGKMQPVSNFWPKIAGVAVILPVIAYAYTDSWRYFYSASMSDKKLYLGYFFPKHTVEISNINDLHVFSDKDALKSDKYRIKLKLSAQEEYISQLMDADELNINFTKLNNLLKKKSQNKD